MSTDPEAVRGGERPGGARPILVATAIGGVAGYVITWLVPRSTGFESYTTFAVFWAALFLTIAALSGIQQEVTRATGSLNADGAATRDHRSRNFAAIGSVTIFGLTVSTAPAWVDSVFPIDGWSLVWPLAVGAACYVVVAVLYGTLYGLKEWTSLLLLMATEALTRLIAVGGVIALSGNSAALAWAVALPIPFALIALWPVVRKRVIGTSVIDVTSQGLVWNVARTIVASTSMGILISGFPLVLGLTSTDEPASQVGLLIVAATLTRAPLVVVSMALQSFLLVNFRERRAVIVRVFLTVSSGVFGAAVGLAALGWLWGPWAFELLFPAETAPDRWLIVALVVSSGIVGILCVSGAAILSLGKHAVYSVGWAVAAVVTVLSLLVPLDLVGRTVLALLLGPLAGVVVHLAILGVHAWPRGSDGGRRRGKADNGGISL